MQRFNARSLLGGGRLSPQLALSRPNRTGPRGTVQKRTRPTFERQSSQFLCLYDCPSRFFERTSRFRESHETLRKRAFRSSERLVRAKNNDGQSYKHGNWDDCRPKVGRVRFCTVPRGPVQLGRLSGSWGDCRPPPSRPKTRWSDEINTYLTGITKTQHRGSDWLKVALDYKVWQSYEEDFVKGKMV